MKKKSKVWLTEEQKELLKASEISNINKEQETYGVLGVLAIGTMFLLALAFIALLLWFNKLNIFIVSGLVLLNSITLGLAYVQFKSYKGVIMKAKNRIEETE